METHTFLASWGEFGPSLEDVDMLTSLPLFNGAHATSIILEGEEQKRVDFFTKSFSMSKYSTNKATYLS